MRGGNADDGAGGGDRNDRVLVVRPFATDRRIPPGSPSRALIDELLEAVTVVAVRPHPGGYERDCGGGGRCVFGEAWTDEHPGPGGHDGCDTRNNVLARDLRGVVFRPGSDNCIVTAGTLDDPYTGARVHFQRAHANAVHIDHIYPLAAAWDHGAAAGLPSCGDNSRTTWCTT